MFNDPIVEDVRKTRYALFAKHGNDLRKWSEAIHQSGICEGHEIYDPREQAVADLKNGQQSLIPQSETSRIAS